MGALAAAVLRAGGEVRGVIPRLLERHEGGMRDLGAVLEVVESMHPRKARMAELAMAFAALPGGLGTFEELLEILTWRSLGYHDRPVGVLDTAGYFQPLIALLDHAVDAGFLDGAVVEGLIVTNDPHELVERLLTKD
jgi:uncharacterized protein (TIGR00730 family)